MRQRRDSVSESEAELEGEFDDVLLCGLVETHVRLPRLRPSQPPSEGQKYKHGRQKSADLSIVHFSEQLEVTGIRTTYSSFQANLTA